MKEQGVLALQLPAPAPRARRRTPAEMAEARAEKEAAEQRRREERGEVRKLAIDEYFRAYEKARGRAPIFCARSGKAIWTLLEHVRFDLERFKGIMRAVYEDDFDKDRLSIIEIASRPASFDREPRKRFVHRLQRPMPLTHERGAGVRDIDDL